MEYIIGFYYLKGEDSRCGIHCLRSDMRLRPFPGENTLPILGLAVVTLEIDPYMYLLSASLDAGDAKITRRIGRNAKYKQAAEDNVFCWAQFVNSVGSNRRQRFKDTRQQVARLRPRRPTINSTQRRRQSVNAVFRGSERV